MDNKTETSEEVHIMENVTAPAVEKSRDETGTDRVKEDSVARDEKYSESDTTSEELNYDQNNFNNNENSQFYESVSSSDSKIDYALKIDDNDTLSDIEDLKTDSADSEDSALGSLPPDMMGTEREEEVQDRSDGSDSGLGSETNEEIKPPILSHSIATPSSSNLHLVPEDTLYQTLADAKPKDKQPLKSSLKRKCDETSKTEPLHKKKKENIKFDNVTVFYFPRAQGFVCVPSQGGSTLGMEWQHTHSQKFTLAEHAMEQRRLHKQLLQQLKSERLSLQGEAFSSSEDSDTEEEASDISDSELDLDSYYFLQPVPTRQRRVLLRAAGVRKIEAFEKDECRDIRSSREFCGCACKGVCNPETCSCSQAGIKCQVDRLNFPCGCTRDGCGNTTGRIEFNPIRVRTHFIHTLMKLGLEKKNEENLAAKKKWNEAQSANIMSNNYEINHCRVQEDGLLRDVNLTPGVEVESCVNNGSFNNVHCDQSAVIPQGNMQNSPVSYGYANNVSSHSLSQHNIMHYDNSNNHCSHGDPYNILQGKGPPYSSSNILGFNTVSNNTQSFPCDLNNYTYEQHNHNYKNLQSFSASSFEEFAHNSQMTMFSHYGHMYAQDYIQKSSTNEQDLHSTIQYHHIPQHHYDMYKTSSDCSNSQDQSGNYTNLMAMPYQTNDKPQTTEDDENWFSRSTLLNLDNSENITQDASDINVQPTEAKLVEINSNETNTDNFGELIKKTMVESVSV